MEAKNDHTADATGLAQAQRQYEDGALELALGGDGPDPVRLRKAIALFEEALGFFAEAAHPLPWARTLVDMAYALWQLPGGTRLNELTAAKKCLDQALRVLTEAATPKEWADAQNTLGLLFSDWAMPGERSTNLREAIARFEAAAKVQLRCGNRWDWAMTQNNLGRTLHELPDPDQAGNLRRAVACYEEALAVLTGPWHRVERAMVQNNLGNALFALPILDGRERADHLRRAAECYRAALEVHTEKAFPHHWALAQSNLGNLYVAQPERSRDEDLLAAIGCYEASLRVFTETTYPLDWARVHDNLGIAYRNLHAGDRAANVERALACHQAALRVYTEEAHPLKWAQTLINLGFTSKSAPVQTDDPDRARWRAAECFTETLRLYTEAEFPLQRATALAYLGHQYRTMQRGDRSANLRQSLAHYQEALRLRDLHGASDSNWAWNHVELANCYRDLPAAGAERAWNLEHAANHYAASLWRYRREAFPREWASAQHQLGRAHHCLGTEKELGSEEHPVDRDSSLRQAVRAYEASLEVYQEQGRDALTWADVQLNLARCHNALTTGSRHANLARVQAGFEAALRVYIKERRPERRASTYQTMGEMCLWRRGWGRTDAAAQAIGYFRKALTVQRGQVRGEAWAVLQTQLGRSHLRAAAGTQDRPQSLRRAVRCFRVALHVLAQADHPWRWAWAHLSLGHAYRALAGTLPRSHDAAAYRKKAAASFRAALSVYTPEFDPATHAGLQADLMAIEQGIVEDEESVQKLPAEPV